MNYSGPHTVDLFDMEPSDGTGSFSIFTIMETTSAFIQMLQPVVPTNISLRLRGGMNPNLDKRWNEIPSLTLQRFQWDGVPKVDFNEVVMFPLNAGLGSISMNGNTLLATVRRTDAGGALGNPPRGAAPPNIVAESMQRNERAFACILNYISMNSMIYKLFMRSFNQQGDAVYRFIQVYGALPTPQKLLTARDDAWSMMSMDKLNMYYTANNYLKWMQIVQEQGRIMVPSKTGQQMKDKFINGLPDSVFKDVKVIMSQSNAFRHPANLGGLGYYAVTPLAANANPLAGQPDVDALARAFLPDWVTRIVSTQKGMHVPSGLVRSVLGSEYCPPDDSGEVNLLGNDDMTETVFMLAKDITSKTRCDWCGGSGHTTTFFKDGVKHVCPSKLLNTVAEPVSKSSAEGNAVKATDLDKMEKKLNSYKTQVHELHDMLHALTPRFRDRMKPKRHGSASVRAAMESDSEESQTGTEGTHRGQCPL